MRALTRSGAGARAGVLGDVGRGESRIAVVASTVDGPAPGGSSGAITFIAVVNVGVDRTSIELSYYQRISTTYLSYDRP